MQVEQLQDVAEVDQEARGLARVVPERLGANPGAALVADAGRVVDLSLLARIVGGHAPMIGVAATPSSNRLLLENQPPTTTASFAPCRSRLRRPSSGETIAIPRSRARRRASRTRPARYMTTLCP